MLRKPLRQSVTPATDPEDSLTEPHSQQLDRIFIPGASNKACEHVY